MRFLIGGMATGEPVGCLIEVHPGIDIAVRGVSCINWSISSSSVAVCI